MGNCRYCNQITLYHCPACFVYVCTPHMSKHFHDSRHKLKATARGIKIDANGKPETEVEEGE